MPFNCGQKRREEIVSERGRSPKNAYLYWIIYGFVCWLCVCFRCFGVEKYKDKGFRRSRHQINIRRVSIRAFLENTRNPRLQSDLNAQRNQRLHEEQSNQRHCSKRNTIHVAVVHHE